MKREEVSIYDITYEWPVNIFRYEGRVFGLTLMELGAVIVGFLVPMLLLGWHPLSLGVSALAMSILLIFIRRIERLGNITIPVYLWKRLRYAREPRTVVLPLIMGTDTTHITIYDPDSDTRVTVH